MQIEVLASSFLLVPTSQENKKQGEESQRSALCPEKGCWEEGLENCSLDELCWAHTVSRVLFRQRDLTAANSVSSAQKSVSSRWHTSIRRKIAVP